MGHVAFNIRVGCELWANSKPGKGGVIDGRADGQMDGWEAQHLQQFQHVSTLDCETHRHCAGNAREIQLIMSQCIDLWVDWCSGLIPEFIGKVICCGIPKIALANLSRPFASRIWTGMGYHIFGSMFRNRGFMGTRNKLIHEFSAKAICYNFNLKLTFQHVTIEEWLVSWIDWRVGEWPPQGYPRLWSTSEKTLADRSQVPPEKSQYDAKWNGTWDGKYYRTLYSM